MEFTIECPHCNQEYSVDNSFIGQKVECTACGNKFTIKKLSVSSSNENSSDIEIENIADQLNNNASQNGKGTSVPSSCMQTPQAVPVKKKTMKEYKILTQKDQWFSGKFDPELLEKAINAYAAQGWRVVSAATASFPGLITNSREEMVIILERDK